jgi:hypothetical protein
MTTTNQGVLDAAFANGMRWVLAVRPAIPVVSVGLAPDKNVF